MKTLHFFLGMLVALAILLGSFLLLLNSEFFFKFLLQITHVYEQVELPEEIINDAVANFISYFRGTSPSLLTGHEGYSIFHAQEVFHMLEVKLIFGVILRIFMGLLVVTSLVLILSKHPRRILSYQRYGMLLIFVLLGVLALNFEKTFLVMHQLLFDNEYWTFTSEHFLIQILTFDFFLYFFIAIFILALAVSLILGYLAKKGSSDDSAISG